MFQTSPGGLLNLVGNDVRRSQNLLTAYHIYGSIRSASTGFRRFELFDPLITERSEAAVLLHDTGYKVSVANHQHILEIPTEFCIAENLVK